MSSPVARPPAVYRFGAFMADARTGELLKHGRRLKLPRIPFEVLLALLETPGELVTRDALQRRLWADGTFVDFDNNLNAAVTRLRQILGDSAERPRFVETLPRLGYRFVAGVERVVDPGSAHAALPPAAGQATGVESGGPSAEADAVDPAVHASRPSRGRMLGLAAIAAAVVWGAGLLTMRGLRPEAGGDAVRLVVLPFQNLTGDASLDYLSEGITEEMISELARIDPARLGIIARTTAFRYKGAGKSLADIAAELHVDFVVEGSVRRDGDTVRVAAQVVEPRQQTQVWADRYERPLRELAALEREMAIAIASAVRVPAVASRPHGDAAIAPGARDAYLLARYFAAKGSVPGILRAIELYSQAVEEDPSYPLAHAGLARALVFATQPAPAIALRRAGESAARARELAPELPEAQLAWAMVLLYRDRDLRGAEREFRRALRLDPGSAETHFYFAQCLTAAGRFDEALAEARRAQELDPFSTLIHHYIGRILHFAGRSGEAVAHLARTLELDSNYAWAHLFMAVAEESRGNPEGAVGARQRYWAVMNVDPERVARLGQLYESSGYSAVRREWIGWIEGFVKKSGFVTSAELAMLYAAEGDRDTAFGWLRKAVDDSTRDLIYLRVYPELAPLRGDPRFAEISARVFPDARAQ